MDVLLIDEDPQEVLGVVTSLGLCSIRVTTAADWSEASAVLERSGRDAFDAILLDLAPTEDTGWKMLESLRSRDVQTPILLVTDRGVGDRAKGLQLGADDYILKPFEPDDLVARIRSVVRRARSLPVYTVRGLRVDIGRRTVEGGGRRIDLTPREFDVLRALVEARGETLSREQLLSDVWGVEAEPGTTMVEVQITRLRKKLDHVVRNVIQTIVGHGYRIPTNLGPPD